MSYEVNILVNGNRCKQYNHNGKIFIEAKQGSEYSIEIKNNASGRILAVCSVDGLDILNGKPAVQDGAGYVINGLNSSRFDGFRVSDDKVAKFVFDYKNSSYAASKGDGSERNVGVVGVRLYGEKYTPPPLPKEIHHHHHHDHWRDRWYPSNPHYNPPIIWCDTTYSTSCGDTSSGGCFGSSLGDTEDCCDFMESERERGPEKYSCDNIPTKGLSGRRSAKITGQSMTYNMSSATNQSALRGFDMGTKWGESKESRVIEVEFEKGSLVLNTNIYYASRQSLVEMGVPLGNEKQVSFPEPFADSKYAKPPQGWRG